MRRYRNLKTCTVPMAHSVGYDGNYVPVSSNDMDSQEGFVHVTQNQNALCSSNSPHLENGFSYFSKLNRKRKHAAADAQTAYRWDIMKEFSNRPPPLRLGLTQTPSLLQLTEEKLNGSPETRTPCNPPDKKIEKLKAVHFPISFLRIGPFKIMRKNEAHLVAKCYYAKRKLVWEILDNYLKHKIEIQWQNILSMRAIIEKDRPGILEIELDKVPMFFRETEPKPGKHTMWNSSQDFTTGHEASKYRRHYLQFPPGVLDKHYMKLLQCDNRLLQLSQRPFPSWHSPYFDSYLYQGETNFSFGHDLHVHGSKTTSSSKQQPNLAPPVVSTQPFQLLGHTMPLSLVAINGSTSLTPGICSPSNDATIYQELLDQKHALWSQGSYGVEKVLATDSVPCASNVQLNGSRSNYEQFSHIENMLLTDYYVPKISFKERHITNIESMSTFAGPSVEAVCAYNTNTSTQSHWPKTSVNSWNALTNGSGEQYYASNANFEVHAWDPFDDQGGLFVDPLPKI